MFLQKFKTYWKFIAKFKKFKILLKTQYKLIKQHLNKIILL